MATDANYYCGVCRYVTRHRVLMQGKLRVGAVCRECGLGEDDDA